MSLGRPGAMEERAAITESCIQDHNHQVQAGGKREEQHNLSTPTFSLHKDN
jgi:hypothetical protein